eukprot:774048-Prymnesium_polylepis.1
MTFALCSHDEAFGHMRRADDGKQAAVIGNPKTVEFQVRTAPRRAHTSPAPRRAHTSRRPPEAVLRVAHPGPK